MKTSFSYAEVGRTSDGDLPGGYRHIRRRAVIGHGRACFDAAGDRLMRWGMQRGAGLRVRPSGPVIQPGVEVVVGWGPVFGRCRVVYVVDDDDRCGFAYGTLQGHPESGEEYFGVHYDPETAAVCAEIVAFSRPGRWWSRAAEPVAAWLQDRFTTRYLRALT